jgi:hypothetical protein
VSERSHQAIKLQEPHRLRIIPSTIFLVPEGGSSAQLIRQEECWRLPMSFLELLPEVQALSRLDKLRLIRLLAEDLAQLEQSTPFEQGRESLWWPDRAFNAAALLLRELNMERPAP